MPDTKTHKQVNNLAYNLLFQVRNREVDLSTVHIYSQDNVDYIGPIGSYNHFFISSEPPEKKEYLTLTRPFDIYTWILSLTSLLGVSISLILIDRVCTAWSKESSTIFQSKMRALFFGGLGWGGVRKEIEYRYTRRLLYHEIKKTLDAI